MQSNNLNTDELIEENHDPLRRVPASGHFDPHPQDSQKKKKNKTFRKITIVGSPESVGANICWEDPKAVEGRRRPGKIQNHRQLKGMKKRGKRRREEAGRKEDLLDNDAHKHQGPTLQRGACSVLKMNVGFLVVCPDFLAVHVQPQAQPPLSRKWYRISFQSTHCCPAWIATALASKHAGAAIDTINRGTTRVLWLWFEQSGTLTLDLPKHSVSFS